MYPILADPDSDPFGKPDVSGHQEGDSWTTKLPDGREVINHIPVGNGTQTVDQTIPDGKGGFTNSRITENGAGGYQRWNDDSSGTASYAAKDTPDATVYGQSFDRGASTSGSPSHAWGASADYQHTVTPMYDDNGNRTGAVYGDQRSDGYWNSAVQDNQGNTTYVDGHPDGSGGIANTVTGQVNSDGTGWRTLEDGRRAEVFTDGNDNPVMVLTDPKTGAQSYRYIEDGIVQENAFDKDGRWNGHTEYRADGTIVQWSRDAQGDKWTTLNPDGSGKVVFDSVNGTISTTTFAADGSGRTTANDGSWQVFDKTGRVTESHGPTDNRSGPEKFVDGFANAADRTASLVGLGSHGVGESWQAVGTGTYRIVSFPFREMHESMMAAATYNPVTGTGYLYDPRADLVETFPVMDPKLWQEDPWGMAGGLAFDATLGLATSRIPLKFPGKLGEASDVPTIDIENATYAQKTANVNFSNTGKFAGSTIDDVANMLADGRLAPSDVPIEVAQIENNVLILNTRSSMALEAAGIPRSSWYVIDVTEDTAAMARLLGQLNRNKLGLGGLNGSPRITGR
ncbi:hypothetical protein [Nocardia brasiliensis]